MLESQKKIAVVDVAVLIIRTIQYLILEVLVQGTYEEQIITRVYMSINCLQQLAGPSSHRSLDYDFFAL